MKLLRRLLPGLLLPWLVAGVAWAAPVAVVLPARAAVEDGAAGGCRPEPESCDDAPADCPQCCFCLHFFALPAEPAAALVAPVRGVSRRPADWRLGESRERPPVPPPKG